MFNDVLIRFLNHLSHSRDGPCQLVVCEDYKWFGSVFSIGRDPWFDIVTFSFFQLIWLAGSPAV